MPSERCTEIKRKVEADFLIEDAERAVVHQMIEIERLRAEGHDTAKAERLLRAFQHTLSALQESRQRVVRGAALN